MLVLTRKIGERILIDGGRIIISVVRVNNTGQVRLGFEAAKEIEILREEVFELNQAKARNMAAKKRGEA